MSLRKPPTFDLLIIGAGLTGLTLAYRLRSSGLNVRILEARNRLGGRIHTTTPAEKLPHQEMGATWLHRPHIQLQALLQELNLKLFEQVVGPHAIYEQSRSAPAQLVQLPPNPEPSHRIQGGTSRLIKSLAAQVPEHWIQLGVQVRSIEDKGAQVEVVLVGEKAHLSAKQVVSTLPPNLFAQTVSCLPSLPEALLSACAKTHTWMGESIKVSIAYREPFLRKPNTSGTIFSNAGPLTELYDHAPVEDDAFALMGFMNGALAGLSKEERRTLTIAQLQKFYGPQAADVLAYNEVVWRDEPYTFDASTQGMVPHQNNGHPIYRQGYWSKKLYLGGSETASSHPGYMEGAVASAQWLSEQIITT